MTLAPPVFVNEDIAKPENRANLALFGLMTVPAIRAWLLERLDARLPADCILYPPQNIPPVGRPDFVVVGVDDTVRAWIEVELGGENAEQLARYRAHFAEPVLSIVGPEKAGGDLSLEAISGALNELFANELDRQQAMNLAVFTTLVRTALVGGSNAIVYARPGIELRSNVLVQTLINRLGSLVRFGTPPVTPGTAVISTITQKGWTLRVYTKAVPDGSVSLLWDMAAGPRSLRVPSRERLKRCFPTAPELVDQYTALFAGVGLNLESLSERQNLGLDEASFTPVLDPFADIVRSFATVYGISS